MKFNKVFLIIFIIFSVFLLIFSVSASDLSAKEFNNLSESNNDYLNDNGKIIYVDSVNGNNANDGSSQDLALKSVDKALKSSKDNYTINLADGTYKDTSNTRLTIDKWLFIKFNLINMRYLIWNLIKYY